MRKWWERNKNSVKQKVRDCATSLLISFETLVFWLPWWCSGSTYKKYVSALRVLRIKRVTSYVCRNTTSGAASQFRTTYYEVVLVVICTQQNFSILQFREKSLIRRILFMAVYICGKYCKCAQVPGLFYKMTHNDVCTRTRVVQVPAPKWENQMVQINKPTSCDKLLCQADNSDWWELLDHVQWLVLTLCFWLWRV